MSATPIKSAVPAKIHIVPDMFGPEPSEEARRAFAELREHFARKGIELIIHKSDQAYESTKNPSYSQEAPCYTGLGEVVATD